MKAARDSVQLVDFHLKLLSDITNGANTMLVSQFRLLHFIVHPCQLTKSFQSRNMFQCDKTAFHWMRSHIYLKKKNSSYLYLQEL